MPHTYISSRLKIQKLAASIFCRKWQKCTHYAIYNTFYAYARERFSFMLYEAFPIEAVRFSLHLYIFIYAYIYISFNLLLYTYSLALNIELVISVVAIFEIDTYTFRLSCYLYARGALLSWLCCIVAFPDIISAKVRHYFWERYLWERFLIYSKCSYYYRFS